MSLALAATKGCSPYQAILGEAFDSLHAHVRRAHIAPLRAEGAMDVTHGDGWVTQPIVWLMKLPAEGRQQSVRLEVADDGPALVWMRRIGHSILRTRQHARGSRLVETMGLGSISFDVSANDGALLYRHSTMRFAGARLPALLSPRVAAVVSGTAQGWHVDVTVTWRDRMVCRYAGEMRAS